MWHAQAHAVREHPKAHQDGGVLSAWHLLGWAGGGSPTWRWRWPQPWDRRSREALVQIVTLPPVANRCMHRPTSSLPLPPLETVPCVPRRPTSWPPCAPPCRTPLKSVTRCRPSAWAWGSSSAHCRWGRGWGGQRPGRGSVGGARWGGAGSGTAWRLGLGQWLSALQIGGARSGAQCIEATRGGTGAHGVGPAAQCTAGGVRMGPGRGAVGGARWSREASCLAGGGKVDRLRPATSM